MFLRSLERFINDATSFATAGASRLQRLSMHLTHLRSLQRNSRNANALYVWIPKTAGTTLNSVLADQGGQTLLSASDAERYFRNRGIVTFGHMSVRHLRAAGIITERFYSSSWKFAFVRNPFDRAVSLFEYLRAIGTLPPLTSFSLFCKYINEHAYERIGAFNHVGLNQLNPQLAWITNDAGEVFTDYIGRFENFENDIRVVFDALRIPVVKQRVTHANRSTRHPTQSYYGDAEVQIIRDAYECDFEAFGYSAIPPWEVKRSIVTNRLHGD